MIFTSLRMTLKLKNFEYFRRISKRLFFGDFEILISLMLLLEPYYTLEVVLDDIRTPMSVYFSE